MLAGFAVTFYAPLLATSPSSRAASWAALLTVAASTCFLVVTLGTTFAAQRVARLGEGLPIPQEIVNQRAPLSVLFLLGILLLLSSFGLGGWIRSRWLGIATTVVAVLGAVGVFAALSPFLAAP